MSHKLLTLARRKIRIRAKVTGTAERPRMSVQVSNRHVRVQIIDDEMSKTLVASDSKKLVGEKSGNLTEVAKTVGVDVAKKAVKAGIKKIVFDRNGLKYHGRVKALADSARENGLEF